jgi:hypothetical protein
VISFKSVNIFWECIPKAYDYVIIAILLRNGLFIAFK